jgi:hypothetical protein
LFGDHFSSDTDFETDPAFTDDRCA